MINSQFIDTETASRIARCTRANVQHAIKRGKLHAIKFAGRWAIHKDEFDKWLSSPKRKAGRPRKEPQNV